MAFLEKFSAAERDLLVSLPYRAGVWISRIDRSGGEGAAGAEIEAVERIIAEKTANMFESAFVHEVMGELYARRSDWPSWADDAARGVTDDARKAVALILAKLSQREVDAYCHNVMLIAVEAAKAFREFNSGVPLLAQIGGLARGLMDRLSGLSRGPERHAGSLSNISYEEDSALSGLAAALGIGGTDGEPDEEID